MCEYANLIDGKCNINKDICPYLYYCNKTMTYKEHSAMPTDCKIKEQIKAPKGFCKVEFERRKRLYILVNNEIIILPNPYNYVPLYVKLAKQKNGNWKIKQAMG